MPDGYNFESYKKLMPMRAGDALITYANISAIEVNMGFRPSIPLCEGLRVVQAFYKI